MLTRPNFTFRNLASRLLDETRAVAAVEFALVASFLTMLLLALCDLVPAYLAYTHASTAASTAADLSGEFSEMQSSDMVNVYSAAADVMAPFAAANQSVRISNIYSDGQGNAKVYWSCGNGSLPPYTARVAVTSTPTGTALSSVLHNSANTSYILTEINYIYTAPSGFLLKSPVSLSTTAFYLPRTAAYVGFPWDGITTDQATVPTAATRSSSVTLSNGATCSYAN
jgi:Flp pilus assembly protein TadG